MFTPSRGFYRPEGAWFGDVMPIVSGDLAHLFYVRLDSQAAAPKDGLSPLDWGRLVTSDFADFADRPIAILHGDSSSRDYLVGAGSVIQAFDGSYLAYYCGINPERRTRGLPEQVILRARSGDLDHWQKDADFEMAADPSIFDRDNWRDPFVWRDADGFHMVVCTRLADGPAHRSGAVAVLDSPDGYEWTSPRVLFTPGTTLAPECPEVFTMGDHRYLLYSTYSNRFATLYAMAAAGSGSLDATTWSSPACDALESNDVYAINTVEFRGRRYAIGWLATRARDKDRGHRQWGGDVVVHELIQRSDGTLGVAPPPARLAGVSPTVPNITIEFGHGVVSDTGDVVLHGPGLSWASTGWSGDSAYFEATVELGADAREFGVALRCDRSFTRYYLLRFEPSRGRVVFDRRPHTISVPFEAGTDRAYVSDPDFEIERPLPTTGSVCVRIFTSGSGITCYVGDVALSTRGYDLREGCFAVYASDGEARFRTVRSAAL